jgi:hypothetical protein
MAKNNTKSLLVAIAPYAAGLVVFLIALGVLKNLVAQVGKLFGFGKAAEQAEQSNNLANSLGSQGQSIRADALTVADALAVNYSWFNPVGYFQDEQQAYDILVKYDSSNFPHLSKMYSIITDDRDLMTDIVNGLSYAQSAVIKNNVT